MMNDTLGLAAGMIKVEAKQIPVDFEALMDSEDDEVTAIGIAGLWLEA